MFDIHFIRPWWFLALLPIVWLLWKAWQVKAKQGAWHQVIAPQFRELLLSQPQNSSDFVQKTWLVGLALVWTILTVLLAGPSLKSVEIPAQKSQQGSVIVLDLSLSMLADDLTPNRLSRVQYKLTDLLNQHPELAVGMVVYAGSSHTISPISEDNQTLLGLIPALNPMIMPQLGSNPIAGFEQAQKLFAGSHITQGHLIWITDDIETEQMNEVEEWLKAHDYSLSIMTVGTQQGAAINIPNYGLLKEKNGQAVLAKVPVQRFSKLSQDLQAPIQALKVENDDLDWLLPNSLQGTNEQQKKDEKSVVHPLDEGAFLLLFIVPLIALAFRRGLLFSFLPILLAGSLLSQPQPAYAESKWQDLGHIFQSHNQQAFKAFNRDDYEAAESLFEDKQWRATSLYRLGRYKEAANLFKQDLSPKAQYNLGNSLAHLGDLQGAIKAYENALKVNPNMKPAMENLELIKRLLQEQKQQQQNQQNQQQQEQQEKSEGQDKSQSESQNGEQQGDKSASSPSQQPQDGKQNNQQSEPSQQAEQNGNNQQSEADSEPSRPETNSQQQENNGKSGDSGDKQTDHSQQHAEKDRNSANGSEDGDQKQQMAQEANKSEQQAKQDETNDTKQTGASRLVDEKEQSDQAESKGKNWEQQQATEAWLQQIPDQPGLFLQRKFKYQLDQAQHSKQEPMEKQW